MSDSSNDTTTETPQHENQCAIWIDPGFDPPAMIMVWVRPDGELVSWSRLSEFAE